MSTKQRVRNLVTPLLTGLAIALAWASIANGKSAETRDLEDFHAITVSGGINVSLHQGTQYRVVVETSGDELDDVITEVKQNTLIIHRDHSSSFFSKFLTQGLRAFWNSNDRVLVTISLPALSKIMASGGSDVKVADEFTAEALEIQTSGGSDIDFSGKIKALSIITSGGSDLTLRGTAEHLELNASGGSDVLGLREFEATDAVINASGGSDVTIRANHSLKISATGGSDIIYSGKPELTDFNNSGGSSIHKR